MLRKEFVSFGTHASSAVAAFIGTLVLVKLSSFSHTMQFVSIIYGASITFLSIASSLYHAKKREVENGTFWRKLDHVAIFFMIAGTYTAVSYLYLPGAWFVSIVSIQWGLVIFGLFFKFYFLNAPRILYTLIYLAMGWMAVIPIHRLYITMPLSQFVLLFSGGISFSVGALFYALKKPVLRAGFFGFHEIFHIMVMIGGALHYALVYRAFAAAAVAL
jgi:hemolysin III